MLTIHRPVVFAIMDHPIQYPSVSLASYVLVVVLVDSQFFLTKSKTMSSRFFKDDILYKMNDFGLYAASLAIMSAIIEFEVKKRQSETTALRNLYRLVITSCENIGRIIVTELK
uniref:Uncharacterized protein n=1 Tax=Glossina brevipalpis TaxID=37001 RepID=A0A1A9WHV0_9MUSC